MTKKALVAIQAPDFAPSGLTGATAATRYAGGTASGAPTSGTFSTGDWVVAQNGHIWVCTAGGTPGTWADTAAAGVTLATSVTSETTYGIAAAVGTSTNVARQDHTHGTPATPATSVAGRTGAVTLTAADIGGGTFSGVYTFAQAPTVTESFNETAYGGGGSYPFPRGLTLAPSTSADATNVMYASGLRLSANYWNGAASATATSYIKGAVQSSAGSPMLDIQTGLVYVRGQVNTTGTLSENGSRVYSAGNPPPYPVSSVAGRTGAVTLTAADVGAGTLPGSYGVTGLLTANGGATIPAGQALTIGTRTIQTGTRSTTTNASDTVDLGTFSSAGGALELGLHTHLVTSAVSLTKVYELALASTMGVGAVVTGITNVGTLVTVTVGSTTGLANGMVVNIAGAAGITNVNGSWAISNVTSTTFQFTATSTPSGTYTANSAWAAAWYQVLPVDTSANSAATNDFALEIARTAVATFALRFRQKSIANTGVITWEAESLGDTAVTFTSSSAVTAAPTAVATLHPSNALTLAAGNVGIGTDSPGNALTIVGGTISVSGTSAAYPVLLTGSAGASATGINLINGAVTGSTQLSVINTSGTQLTDTVANDSALTYTSGAGLRVGPLSGASVLVIGTSVTKMLIGGTATQNDVASALTSYTPSWTAVTTNPAIGNGTIVGAYKQIGKMVFFRVSIAFGSTTTYGSGAYSISLPVAAVTGVPQTTGPGRFANGAGNYVALFGVIGSGATTVQLWGPSSSTSALQINVTNAAPFATLANGGGILLEGWYEAA
jgi:hypothetical protein